MSDDGKEAKQEGVGEGCPSGADRTDRRTQSAAARDNQEGVGRGTGESAKAEIGDGARVSSPEKVRSTYAVVVLTVCAACGAKIIDPTGNTVKAAKRRDVLGFRCRCGAEVTATPAPQKKVKLANGLTNRTPSGLILPR